MFERRGRIALSILLSVLVTSFLIGARAQEASAQIAQATPPPQQVQAPSTLPVSPSAAGPATQHKTTGELIIEDIGLVAHYIRVGIAVTGVAPMLAAIIAGCFAWTIAEYYTKQLKQFEATLEFSKRFHELIQQQRVLNRKYDEDRSNGAVTPAADKIDKQDADAWWWRFFDLLLYEYDFYQKGMVRKARFEEWMVWRWHDFHPEAGKEWKTCGIAYKDAWAHWKEHPAHSSRLIELLEEIHDITDPKNLQKKDRNRVLAKKIRDKVKLHGPGWLKRTDLEKAYR
jgi:hypothetical protein